MRRASLLVVTALLGVAGCGSDDDSGAARTPPAKGDAETLSAKKPGGGPSEATKAGTTIALGESEFGKMLFDSAGQAIYIFENDPKGETACYGECAKDWPPVYTGGEPKAGDGVREELLGTVKRRDGRLQVTYADQPLYFYAHEKPGEVRCHNVDLNGGLWWVVGPDGKRRP